MSRTTRIARALIAGIAERVETLARKYPSVPVDQIREMAQIDPTGPKGQYLEWIVRLTQKNNIRWPEDKNRAQRALAGFQDLKKQPRYFRQYNVSPDVNQYTLPDLERIYRQVHGEPDPAPGTSGGLPNGASSFYREGAYEILRVGGPGVDLADAIGAACALGEGTFWCTREEENAQTYLKRGPLYIIRQGGHALAQYDPETEQLMDTDDNPISVGDEEHDELFILLFNAPLHLDKSISWGILSRFGRRSHEGSVLRDTPFRAQDVGANPEAAYLYAFYVRKGRVPEVEKSIASDPPTAIAYARHLIDGRWPQFEAMAEAILGQLVEQVLHGGNPDFYKSTFRKWNSNLARYRRLYKITDWPAIDHLIQMWDRLTGSDAGGSPP